MSGRSRWSPNERPRDAPRVRASESDQEPERDRRRAGQSPGAGSQVPPAPRCGRNGAWEKPRPWCHQPVAQSMACPSLGLLLALGLPLLLARWDRAWGQTSSPSEYGNSTSTTPRPSSDGALSKEATTAIIVVFSLLAALLLAVGLVLLVRKLREKRQTEGSYRPSSEEQLSHAAEAQAPQDSKETVRGCLPI